MLDKPCTRCQKKTVVSPTKNDLKKPLILVRCLACGKYSRYNIHTNKSYWLSKWGRDKIADEYKKRAATISWNKDQEERTRARGETRQSLIDYAYRIKILMLDK